jgi:hypothetical protein
MGSYSYYVPRGRKAMTRERIRSAATTKKIPLITF